MTPTPEPTARPGRLTDAELEAMRAYAETGDYQRAADRLGISYGSLLGRLARARRRSGIDSTVTLIWTYRDKLERAA